MASRGEVAKVLRGLALLYPHSRLDEDAERFDRMAEAWFGLLGALDVDVLRVAALRACRLSPEFIPPAPAVLSAAMDLHEPAAPRTGLEAWRDVLRAIAAHGSYHPPHGFTGRLDVQVDWDFEDPLVREVALSIASWRDLCLADEASMMTARAHFIRSYEAAARRERDAQRELPAEGRARALIAQTAKRLTGGTR